MKKDEYLSLIKALKDPYSVWIKEKEIKREAHELVLPPEYSIFLDGDGDIDPKISAALTEYGAFSGGYDFIYTDEDELDPGGRRHDPYFKPDYSPDTLDSFYYPGGLTIVSNDLAARAEGYGFKTGSLEFLRECGKRAEKPLHIPEVLYHAGTRHNYSYRDKSTDFSFPAEAETEIAVIILSKDHPELLSRCIKGLLAAAEREGVCTECIVIDNGSSEENTEQYRSLASGYGFSYVREERDFVYSALCNKGAGLTKAKVLLFLNDDIEIPENILFLKKMMKEALNSTTGAVGCKLLYPGGKKIQHCGITLLKSGASHCFAGYDDSEIYARGINRIRRNVFAVTGACLMVERRKFDEAGGFDENLAVAYTDVDLCSGLLKKGYYNLCLNDIYLFHHESVSRKSDQKEKEKYLRLKKERSYFYDKYRDLLMNGDPWYNRNLTGTGLDYGVDTDTPYDRVPFYTADTYRSPELNIKAFKKAEEGKVYRNIEVLEYRSSDALGHEDFLEISGWGFIRGRAGYECDIYVKIKDGSRELLLKTGHVPREDLAPAFPKENALMLSGFSVKAERGMFENSITEDGVSLVFAYRDFFGRDKGFITDES